MSDSFDKVLARVPHLDGGFRRKIVAGLILTLSIYGVAISINITDADSLKYLTENSILVFYILFIVFALGSIIETLSDLFIKRLLGVLLKIFRIIIGYVTRKKHDGEINIESQVGKEALAHFQTLPSSVRLGVKSPFGKLSECAWNYFCTNGSADSTNLAIQLRAKNQDMLVMVSSLSMSIFMLAYPLVFMFDNGGLLQGEQPSDLSKIEYINTIEIFILLSLLFIPFFFVFLYFSVIKQSITSILEFRALGEQEYNANN